MAANDKREQGARLSFPPKYPYYSRRQHSFFYDLTKQRYTRQQRLFTDEDVRIITYTDQMDNAFVLKVPMKYHDGMDFNVESALFNQAYPKTPSRIVTFVMEPERGSWEESDADVATSADSDNIPEEKAVLLMPKFPGLNLSNLMATKPSVVKEKMYEILLAMCNALASLHERDVIHGDVKAKNVLIDVSAEGVNAYFVDFEWAYRLDDMTARGIKLWPRYFSDKRHLQPITWHPDYCRYWPIERQIYFLGELPSPAFNQDVFSMAMLIADLYDDLDLDVSNEALEAWICAGTKKNPSKRQPLSQLTQLLRQQLGLVAIDDLSDAVCASCSASSDEEDIISAAPLAFHSDPLEKPGDDTRRLEVRATIGSDGRRDYVLPDGRSLLDLWGKRASTTQGTSNMAGSSSSNSRVPSSEATGVVPSKR